MSETPAGGPGLEYSTERVNDSYSTAIWAFLRGQIQSHELPTPLWQLWSDGYRTACIPMQQRVDQANREADYWYWVANNPAAERYADHKAGMRLSDIAQARKRQGVTA